MKRAAYLVSLLGCALAACKVSPDFERPRIDTPRDWAELGQHDLSQPTRATEGAAEIARWWTVFDDATLTSLIERATAGNLDLREADARLRGARAAATIAGAGRWPTVDASAAATRAESAGANGGRVTQDFYRAGFDAAWELDIFGGVARGVEAARADVEAAARDRDAVTLSLAAEVATTYFSLRGAQLELDVARRNLETQRQALELTRQRFQTGLVGALDVSGAEAQVDTTVALVPELESDVQSSIHALGVLLGEQPEALLVELSTPTPLPATPPRIAVGLPSDLLRRRPDIQRAEADLHAATARVGVAIADLFPHLSLTGSLGVQGAHVSSLGNFDNRFWTFGPSLSLPIFNAGALRANVELQRAVSAEQLAAYEASVLTALREVEGALVALAKEQQRRAALTDAVAAEARAIEYATQLYTAGRTDFLNVLAAQRAHFEGEDQLARSEQAVATDVVALYKALGGGWDAPNATSDAPEQPTNAR